MSDRTLFNVYGDESCHLQHLDGDVMVLGAVVIPAHRARELAVELRALKVEHGLPADFEIKWTKISPARVDFYRAVVDFFIAAEDVSFRAWVAHGKSRLRHGDFDQDHNTWYHKMYYEMLRPIVAVADRRFHIYIDIKDGHGGAKARTLQDVLAAKLRDPNNQIVERIQIVRSDEVEAVQLADLLIGAVSYRNRGQTKSAAKVQITRHFEQVAGVGLTRNTKATDTKVNIFHWKPQEPSE